MKNKRAVSICLLALLGVEGPARADDFKNALIGTWDLTETFSGASTIPDGTVAPSTLTVIAGLRAGEGSALHSSFLSLAPPEPTMMEQGTWKHDRKYRFIASYAGWAVNSADGTPAGQNGFRYLLTLDKSGERLIGHGRFYEWDDQGTLIDSADMQVVGQRQHPRKPD